MIWDEKKIWNEKKVFKYVDNIKKHIKLSWFYFY